MAGQTGANERPRAVGWRVWLWWTLASTVGWAVFGVLLGPVILVAVILLAGASLGVAFGAARGLITEVAVIGAVAGVLHGFLQWLVLRRQIERAGRWIAASAVGWTIEKATLAATGVLMGSVIGWAVSGAFFQVALLVGVVGGVVGGTVTGVLQWLVLRRQLARAGRWIVASVVSEVIGKAVLVVIGVVVGSEVGWVVGWVVGGFVTGVISGAVLVWLLRGWSSGRLGWRLSWTDASETPLSAGWRLWVWWVVAGTIGWVVYGAVFFPVLFVRSMLTNIIVEVDGVAAVFGVTVVGAVVGLGGGTVVGVLQWLVLQRRLERTGRWIVASTVGGSVAGALLMVAVAIANVDWIVDEAVLIGGAWFVGGVVAAILQWLVLRRQIARADWWIVTSTIGWAIGVAVVLLGGISVGVGEVVLAVGWAVGGVVGSAITGAVLVWLLRQRLGDADGAGGKAARVEAMGDRDSEYASAG